jgi:hypothetical protein
MPLDFWQRSQGPRSSKNMTTSFVAPHERPNSHICATAGASPSDSPVSITDLRMTGLGRSVWVVGTTAVAGNGRPDADLIWLAREPAATQRQRERPWADERSQSHAPRVPPLAFLGSASQWLPHAIAAPKASCRQAAFA